MKSPPIQIHDDIAHNRVEAFIRGEDNEVLDGTQKQKRRSLKHVSSKSAPKAADSAANPEPEPAAISVGK
jgi:hypothetical protein